MNSLLISLLLAVATPLISARAAPYIIGGRNARVGEFPYQGSLQVGVGDPLKDDPESLITELYDSHTCGCAVVSNIWVVTAAHCVGRGPNGLSVILGYHQRGNMRTGAPKRYRIARIISHPGWTGVPGGDDIAMMQLTTYIQFNNYVRPIRMAASGQNFDGRWCTISGWGVTTEGGGSLASILQAASVAVVPLDTCAEYIPVVGQNHVCVGVKDQRGSCQGDSGGPLACDGVLVGVTSFGIRGCFTSFPSVYASIPAFRNWVRQVSGL